MRTAFGRIFWGFLLVLIDIDVFIDLLPNPVGYLLIFSGIAILLDKYPIGKKAYTTAILLTIVSIPTIFIHATEKWWVYAFGLGALKLLLVFFLFQLMLEIARVQDDAQLFRKTSSTMKFYMISFILVYIATPFTINSVNQFNSTSLAFATILAVAILIVEIIFLLLLLKFRHLDEETA
ncbi:hypothetical protein [Lentibacillus saliphilus]|uniref:hypothetical protein n=1 Tax=Lentibacillus saliphilus TaxID=2737028 RepID=UPI001C302A37|nr:hypothetical protein [Lentibacillus saliphilus]